MFLIDIDNIVLIFLRWEEILYLGSYKSWCRFGGWGLKVVIKSLLPSYKKQFSKKMMKLLIETWSDDDIGNYFLNWHHVSVGKVHVVEILIPCAPEACQNNTTHVAMEFFLSSD